MDFSGNFQWISEVSEGKEREFKTGMPYIGPKASVTAESSVR